MNQQKQIQKQDTEQYLSEVTDGFYLLDHHARMIWQKNKSLIVKSMKFENVEGKQFYLIGNNLAYSVIKINSVHPISLDMFRNLEEKHRISDKEAKNLFGSKKMLFAYEFEVIHNFDIPKMVAIPKDTTDFIAQVQFLSEPEIVLESEKLLDIVLLKDFICIDKEFNFFFNAKKDYNIIQKLSEKKLMQSFGKEKIISFTDSLDNEKQLFEAYDLVLVKKEPKSFSKNLLTITPMVFFEQPKPKKVFHDIDSVLKFVFEGGF